MDGRRFGVGLVAGLLFALAIVAASGLASGTSSFSLAPANVASSTATSSTVTASTTATVPQGGLYTSVNTTLSNLSSNASQASANAANGNGPTFTVSSSVASIDHQPLLSQALLFAPIAVAVLLGVLLYRISARGRIDNDEEP